MESGEPANVDRPHIVGRLALDYPGGQRHARTATRRNTHGIETAADEEAAHLGGLAKDEHGVLGKGFEAVEPLLDADGLERGNALQRGQKDLLEMLDLFGKQLELVVVGNRRYEMGMGLNS